MSSRPHIVRSVSLDTELALWVEQQAAGENRSVSNFVNTLLARLRERAAPPQPPPVPPPSARKSAAATSSPRGPRPSGSGPGHSSSPSDAPLLPTFAP
jgi:hypothetical protein